MGIGVAERGNEWGIGLPKVRRLTVVHHCVRGRNHEHCMPDFKAEGELKRLSRWVRAGGFRQSVGAALVVALCVLAGIGGVAHASGVSSYAFVNNDGSIRIKGRTFRLYGLYIPPSAYTCQRFYTPVTCSSQVSIALDFKIGSHFVRCEPVAINPDGTEAAFCNVEGEDLGAYLLQQGWALALPGAPIDYAMFERIARGRGIGVWVSPWYNIYNFPPP